MVKKEKEKANVSTKSGGGSCRFEVTNEPQPEVPDFISSFLLDGTCERSLFFPLAFSRSPFFVTSHSDV